jgi:hypothetical protein
MVTVVPYSSEVQQPMRATAVLGCQASFGVARPEPRCLRCRFYEPRVDLSTPPNATYGRTGSTGDANAFSGWTSNMMLTTRIHKPSSGSTIDCRFSSLA